MPVFEVQGPDGKSYEVDAPHEQAAMSAFQSFAPPAQSTSTATDIAKSAGIGVAKGGIGLAGMGGDLQAIGQGTGASDYLSQKLEEYFPTAAKWLKDETAKTMKSGLAQGLAQGGDTPGLAPLPSSSDIQSAIESKTGKFYEPQTPAGKVAETFGEFVPGALMGGGNPAQNIVRYAALPVAAGQGVEHFVADDATAKPYLKTGAEILTGAMGHRVITPNPMTVGREAAVNALENEGVDRLTAGQRTGNRKLLWTESVLADQPFSGSGATEINTHNAERYTAAAMRRVGEPNAPYATSEVVDNAFNRVGNQFDQAAARNTALPDAQLGNDLVQTQHDYNSLVGPSQRAPIVEDTIRDIGDQIASNNGALPGPVYQAMRSRLSAAARGSSDPQLSHALSDITEALDDNMARSIAANNPNDAGMFETARRQYRNLLVIERAATTAGPAAARGEITPAALSNATKAVMGRRAYARGQGDFADLARSGVDVMTPLPNSGTAPRENVIHNLQLAGLLATEGTAAGAMSHGLTGGAVGFAGGVLAPALIGRAIMSPVGQTILANQLMRGAGNYSPIYQAALAQQLMRPTQTLPSATEARQ